MLFRLIRYLKPYWGQQVVTMVAMMVLASLALAIPLAVRYMIDDLIPKLTETVGQGVDLTPIVLFGAALLGIYLANVVFSLIRDFFATRIGASIVRDLRSEVFFHLEHVSLEFHQTHQTGEVMSRVLSDVNRVQGLLTSTLLAFLTHVMLVVAILVYLLQVNWVLTLVAVIPVPLSVYLSNRFGGRLHVINRKLQETMASVTGRLQEALTSVKTVKAFGQEDKEKGRLDSELEAMIPLYVSNGVNMSLAVNLIHFVNTLGPVVVLAWGTYLIAGGAIKLGALVAFYMLLTYLYQPISEIAKVNVEVQAAMSSVIRIFEYLDLPMGVVEDVHPVVLEQARGEIRLEGVSYRYGDNGFGLHGISLWIRPGEKVAVVGPSGAGKTTLVNLIMRFFDPDQGAVYLDGIDLKKLALKSLKRQMGLVEQEPVLFKASIRENISYADESAVPHEVRRAAEIANIVRFVDSLPDGFDTEVGERGVTVSGGERQRLCLARAILHDPPVLILDEATSALDSQAEEMVRQALEQSLEGKTAIIVAHRMSTVRCADRIIVMDGGRIVDEGTHERLMDVSDLYRELATRQMTV